MEYHREMFVVVFEGTVVNALFSDKEKQMRSLL